MSGVVLVARVQATRLAAFCPVLCWGVSDFCRCGIFSYTTVVLKDRVTFHDVERERHMSAS